MAQEQLTQIVNLIARAEKAERERDEARERADRAERFCARASTAAGSHGFVCADAVSLRGDLAALIARAAEAIEPFEAFAPPDYVPDDMPMTQGSRLAKRQVTAKDFRRLAALAADLRKAGEGI